MEDKKYTIRRIMLAKLETEKEEIRNDIAEMQRALNGTIKLQQTVRHCKKEVLAKYLEDPEFQTQYSEMVAKFKEAEELENDNGRESEERSESLAGSGEQPDNEA